MVDSFYEIRHQLIALRGVNCGLLSTEDVELVARRAGVEEPSLPLLHTYLRAYGIDIISEEQKASLLSEKTEYYTQSPKPAPFSQYDEKLADLLETEKEEARRLAWFRRAQAFQNDEIKAVIAMKQQKLSALEIAASLDRPVEDIYYAEYRICEMLRLMPQSLISPTEESKSTADARRFLIQFIAESETNKTRRRKRSEAEILANAVLRISHLRVEEIKREWGGGWVCGTHTHRLREKLAHRISMLYSDEECIRLRICCAACNGDINGFNNHNADMSEMLDALIEMRPDVIVHPPASW